MRVNVSVVVNGSELTGVVCLSENDDFVDIVEFHNGAEIEFHNTSEIEELLINEAHRICDYNNNY